jgi:hypothetical protein
MGNCALILRFCDNYNYREEASQQIDEVKQTETARESLILTCCEKDILNQRFIHWIQYVHYTEESYHLPQFQEKEIQNTKKEHFK